MIAETKYKDFAALLAGITLVFAFAPFQIHLLALFCPAILFYTLNHSTPRRAAMRGLLFGLGFFGVGVSWIYVSIRIYGETPMLLAAFLTLLFVLYCASFFALGSYVLQRYFAKSTPLKALVTFPAIWVLFEWLRSVLFTGFPWLLLGYSQTGSSLAGFAPIIGIYGIAFIVVSLSGCLSLFFQKKSYPAAFYLLFIFAVWISGAYLESVRWTQPFAKPMTASVVQGNLQQPPQWSADFLVESLLTYQELTLKHLDSQIVLLPESAIPASLQNSMQFIGAIGEAAKKKNSTVILGIPSQHKEGLGYYNSVIAIGQGQGKYHKRHLVPFGEYTPLQSVIVPIMNYLQIPMSDLVPGEFDQTDILSHGIHIAPYICYEIAYPKIVRSDLPGANLLITISNDAWFGDSLAPAQHTQIAQMRSIQTGRYQLVATNTGVSAIIDPSGHMIKRAPSFEKTVITHQVQPYHGATPWVTYGNRPILISIALLLLLTKMLLLLTGQSRKDRLMTLRTSRDF